ncbi:tetratricopeptide repeat protein [Phaeospirillum tilakii]|uniref:Tetratricopeptide repeat protein n=1 Tax=Phaeospirillum tilakii TaxID=741673 RepID=A0ABW5C7S5_9PROT
MTDETGPETGTDTDVTLAEAIGTEAERAELACREGDEAGALDALARLARLAPDRIGAALAAARLHRRAGRLRLALSLCLDLLARHPDDIEIRQEVAECLDLAGCDEAARDLHRRLLREQPEKAASWCGLGRLLLREGHLAAAEACLRRALALDPADLPALEGVGRLLGRLGEARMAGDLLRDALCVAARPAPIQTALAGVLLAEGRAAEALAWLDRALAHDPAEAEARALRAELHQRAGRRDAAWEDAAWARRLAPPPPPPFDAVEPWQGEPVEGLTLWLYPEGSPARTLRLLRVLPVLAEQGIAAVLPLPPPLRPLLGEPPAGVRFEADPAATALPPGARVAALPDLPRLLGLDPLPPPLPLTPPPRPQPPLARPFGTRLAVGLAWGGDDPAAAPPPEAWLDLALVAGVALFGLEPAVAGITDPTLIGDLAQDCADAADLAARLAQLDLVIGPPSLASELAATLGRPVWQIVPAGADPCWGETGETTPLYPSMRLFRAEPGLPPPLERIAAALAEAAAGPAAETVGPSDPFDPDATLATGRLLAQAGRRAAAAICFRRALTRRADPAIAAELADTLRALGRPEAAATVLEPALAAAPESAPCRQALALVRRDQGRLDDALALLDGLATDTPGRNQTLAETLLAAGRVEEGLARFGRDRPLPPEPRWDGGPPEGRGLVVVADGDAIETVLLARYLPLAAARGGLVTLVAPAELAGLLDGLAGLEAVRPPGPAGADEAGALHARLSDLPRLLGGPDGVLAPPTLPYLPPPPAARRRDGRLRVGLAWGGVPRRAACPLEPLLCLAAEPAVTLVALAGNGPAAAELAAAGATLLVETAGPAGTAGLAARLAEVDLVIGGDRLETHLAAAMGLPVWLIPPATPNWRWPWRHEDSPWYPSARLFPRRPDEGWRETVARIGAALRVVASSSAQTTRFRLTSSRGPL